MFQVGKEGKELFQIKNSVGILVILLSSFLESAYLNEINGIKKLSNYDELKTIEVEKIVDRSKIKRNNRREQTIYWCCNYGIR